MCRYVSRLCRPLPLVCLVPHPQLTTESRLREAECDEGRPPCARCASTGHVCDGHGGLGAHEVEDRGRGRGRDQATRRGVAKPSSSVRRPPHPSAPVQPSQHGLPSCAPQPSPLTSLPARAPTPNVQGALSAVLSGARARPARWRCTSEPAVGPRPHCRAGPELGPSAGPRSRFSSCAGRRMAEPRVCVWQRGTFRTGTRCGGAVGAGTLNEAGVTTAHLPAATHTF